jgi:hypothetical protein
MNYRVKLQGVSWAVGFGAYPLAFIVGVSYWCLSFGFGSSGFVLVGCGVLLV